MPASNRREGGPKLVGRLPPADRSWQPPLPTIYDATEADEEYFCNYEVNRQYLRELENAGLRLTAFDENGELRAVELPDHRFFVATLFQPQLSSAEDRPHALIVAYLNASAGSRVYS